jgi:hypothetical protein
MPGLLKSRVGTIIEGLPRPQICKNQPPTSMLPRTFSLSHCTALSVLNVLGFFLFARYAEAMGFVGENALGTFSISVGIMTMLVTSVLLVWSALDHFLVEPTGNSAFALSVNLGFMCAFVLM